MQAYFLITNRKIVDSFQCLFVGFFSLDGTFTNSLSVNIYSFLKKIVYK